MAVVGCDIPVRQVVGADRLAQASAGVWTKTHFYQEGDYLHAKTFLVAAGEPCVLDFRIDLRPLEKVAARIHQRLHEKMVQKSGGPVVGFSFSKAFKSIKSAAKSIGKSKLVKAVGGAIKKVASSKLVGTLAAGLAVAVPVIGLPALAAYGSAKAAIGAVNAGKKLVTTAGKAQHTIAQASTLTTKLSAAKAQAPARVQASTAAAQARANAQAKAIATQGQAKAAAQLSIQNANAVRAAAANRAKQTLAAGKAQAVAAAKSVVAQVKTAETKVAPVVAAAARIQAKLADPAVRAKLEAIKNQAASAKKVLEDIKLKASTGTGAEKLDAQKSAAIVNLVAKNEARIQAMSQTNAGGLPSLLIDAKGRIVPGKFRVVTAAGGKNPDVLYQGPKSATQRGAFAKVSGDEVEVGAVQKPWTIELWHAGNWHPQAKHGARFGTHAEASQAITWYRDKGYKAQVAPYPRVKSQPKIRIGAPIPHHYDPRQGTCMIVAPPRPGGPGGKWPGTIRPHVPSGASLTEAHRIGASPFPPPSPREQRAKEQAYAEWLVAHAPRTKVGYEDDPEIGCDEAEVSGRRSPFTSLGWPLVKYDPKTGSALRGRIRMNPKSGHLYPDTSQGYRRAVADFNSGKHYRVGWSSPPSYGEQTSFVGWAPSPSWATTIGCPCSDQGTQF